MFLARAHYCDSARIVQVNVRVWVWYSVIINSSRQRPVFVSLLRTVGEPASLAGHGSEGNPVAVYVTPSRIDVAVAVWRACKDLVIRFTMTVEVVDSMTAWPETDPVDTVDEAHTSEGSWKRMTHCYR